MDDPGKHPHYSSNTGLFFPKSSAPQAAPRLGDNGEPLPLTAQEYSDVMDSGKSYVAVYGIVRYDDIFGIHHWTKFCKFFGGHGRALKPMIVQHTTA
jgi:hypothetical protein